MTILPDGIQAAASWEHTFHPKRPDGKDITAWKRRAETIDKTIAKVNDLEARVAALEAQPRPFP